MKYAELKSQLKEWAKQIRVYKNHRKFENRGNYTLSFLDYEILKLKWEFRHHHIAYCELRGRQYHEIERPSESNLPDRKFVDGIKTHWSEMYNESRKNETVCSGENRLTQ